MVTGQLPPKLEALARMAGAEAAHATLDGRRPTPCQWDANGESLTYARMAAAWSDAFLEVRPAPSGDLPE